MGPLLEIGNASFSISDEQGAAVTFSYDANTQWFNALGEPIGPDSVALGDMLLVDALGTAAGWYAIGVMDLQRDGGGGGGNPGEPITLEGVIQVIGNGKIVLDNGAEVRYDDNTQWFLDNAPAEETDFAPGDYVIIDATQTDTGLLAFIVNGMRNGNPGGGGYGNLTYVGELTAIDDSSLTLGGDTVFAYNDATQWFNADGEAGPDDFTPGMQIEVEATISDNGGLLAVIVIDLDGGNGGGRPGDPGSIVSFAGVISLIGNFQIVLEDQTQVGYNDATMWFDELGQPAGPEDFAAGDFVYVTAEVEPDNSLLALDVVKGPRDPNGGGGADIVYLTGQIDFIGNMKINLIDGTSLDYNEFTNWYDEFNNETGPDSFEHGDWVFIEALAFTDNWLATNVYKLPGDPNGGGGQPR